MWKNTFHTDQSEWQVIWRMILPASRHIFLKSLAVALLEVFFCVKMSYSFEQRLHLDILMSQNKPMTCFSDCDPSVYNVKTDLNTLSSHICMFGTNTQMLHHSAMAKFTTFWRYYVHTLTFTLSSNILIKIESIFWQLCQGTALPPYVNTILAAFHSQLSSFTSITREAENVSTCCGSLDM